MTTPCRTVLLATSAVLFAAASGLAADSPLKVFILAGQSNMEGQGVVSMDEVRAALAELDGAKYELCGFVWMQGWNDMCSKEATAEYAENLVNLITDVRAGFESPDLPVVVGELGNGGPAKPGSGMEAFRKAQREGTGKIPHARFVSTQQFARPAELSPNRGHGHHWFGNAESYFLVGDSLGEAMIGLLNQ